MNTQKLTLNILIIASGLAAIVASYGDEQRWYWALKPLTTILIIGLPVLFSQAISPAARDSRKLIIMALVFCLAGDIFLLNGDYFAFGLGAFLVAHLIFAVIFYKLSNNRIYPFPLIILLGISIAYFILLKPALEALAVPVAIYFTCIAIMCWQSFRLCLSRRDSWGYGVAIAATLFVVSDSIIAADKFLIPFDAASVLILGFYWISICLLANLFSGTSRRSEVVNPEG